MSKVLAIVLLVLLVWVRLCLLAAAQECSNQDSGCPISTSPADVEECKGVDKLFSVSYCGGFALCLQDGLGIRYRCPAGFVPGPRCVSKDTESSNSSTSCPQVCENVNDGCANGSADPALCTSPTDLTFVDDPDACGQFVMCIGGAAYSLFCPEGYRSDVKGSRPKCVPDYRCTARDEPRLEVCKNFDSGCPVNKTAQPTELCSRFTTYGLFDHPDQCGIFVICLPEGDGVTYECPVGYRTDVLQAQPCVLDPGCPTPVSPRLAYSANGCKDVLVGCATKNTTSFDDCKGKPPYRTNINDPIRCGYYQKCTWQLGSYAALEYVCPAGFKADVTQERQICVLDDRCPAPNSARLSVVLKTSGSGGRSVRDLRCSNTAFGCPLSEKPTERDECPEQNVLSTLLRPSRCDQYLLCLPRGQGLDVQCPLGYRARTSHPPYCLPDPSCDPVAE